MAAKKLIIVSVLFLVGCGGQFTPAPPTTKTASENWPAFTPDPAWQPQVAAAVQAYIAAGYTYQNNLQDYSAFGDYLRTSSDSWRNIPGVEQLDANGVPMIAYNGAFFYNPATVEEFALSEHGKFLVGAEPDLTKFWAGVNQLMALEQPDGSLPYTFDFPYYLNDKFFHAPWTSGMAQGMALSVFARAWEVSGDAKYLDAGNRSFAFLLSTLGNLHSLDPSLAGQILVDEYPADPSAYTLNGFMFAMLGLYDWSQVPGNGNAALYFSRCLDTLDHILPYYDAGGFSIYDMGHITYGQASPHLAPSYHAVHIYLLHALFSVTQDATVEKYEMAWRAVVPK